MKHTAYRQPAKGKRGLSWGRTARADDGSLVYSLFRRDARNRLHYFVVVLSAERSAIDARRLLRDSCRRLRDQVDEVDLRVLETA